MRASYVSYQLLRSLVLFLESKGLSRTACLTQLGCSEQELHAHNSAFSLNHYQRLMRWAHKQLNCPYIGLSFGAQFDLDRWGVLGHLASVSPDLRRVIDYGRRFHPLVRHTQSLTLHQQPKTLTLDLGPTQDGCYYVIDELFASWLSFARTYMVDAETLAPLQIQLMRAAPQDLKERRIYDNLFRCPLQFEAPSNTLSIPRELINRPLKQPDKTLEQVLLHQAQQQLNSHYSLSDAVKLHINAHLPEIMRIEQLAALFGLPARSLQRQLARQDTSYAKLLDECRQHLALQLFESGYSALEVTNKLGFSEQSALQRAFKRWFYLSPKRFFLHQHTLEINSDGPISRRIKKSAPG
ncbi:MULTISPECIES: AraC family transcriptional regulator [unclassified Pseudoalteromonas]|uniref:AraC family transcriptional regulator n=1 Tax=unclassified Pseudoalteromonas TaxID=194690 RepID=UPI000CF5FA69|nr:MULTISPECIES: AraC family transcriptional regulator [unclassified Pseudoalteromonas]